MKNFVANKISVLMSVFNEPLDWVKSSINSILNQSYKDFEFIIIIDNPISKDLINFVRSIQKQDDRIKLIVNENNFGLTRSLNIGLSMSSGEYVARMDADDISLPNRFEEQINYLKRHPSVDVLNSYVIKFKGKGKYRKLQKSPGKDKIIKRALCFNNILFHPAILMKANLFSLYNVQYNENFRSSQDYCLWLTLSLKGAKFATIKKPLLLYRISDTQISSLKRNEQFMNYQQIRIYIYSLICNSCSLKLPLKSSFEIIHELFYQMISNNAYSIIGRSLIFQLYYSLEPSFAKYYSLLLLGFKYKFSLKQILIIYLSYFTRRWNNYDINNLLLINNSKRNCL